MGTKIATHESEERKAAKAALANTKDSTYQAGFWGVFLFAMGIVLSGPIGGWNAALEYGYLSCVVGTTIMTTGYLALTLCLSELTSITNFAGGIYGYSRCSLGPAYGYTFGMCELLQNNFFCLSQVAAISNAISYGFGLNASLEPIWVVMTYLLLLCIHLRGGPYFWGSMSVLAIFTMLVMVLYLISAMTESQYIYTVPLLDREGSMFNEGGAGVMKGLLFTAWFYIGIETVTVTGAKIENGTQILPKVMLIAMCVLIVQAFWTTAVVFFGFNPKHPATDLYISVFPMGLGFSDHLHMSARAAGLMAIPCLFGTATAFCFAAKHQLHAMSLSGILDPWFRPVYGPGQVPWRALISSVAVQLVIYLVLFYCRAQNLLFPMTILGASGSYIGLFSSYLTFQDRFPTMERGLTIPHGDLVAKIGILAFSVVFISIIGFQDEAQFVVPMYFIYLLACWLYYYRVAEKRQFFSHEEQKKFMKAYILNANKMKKRGKLSGVSWHRRLLHSAINGATSILRGGDTSKAVVTSSHSTSSGGSAQRQSISKNSQILPDPLVKELPCDEVRSPDAVENGEGASPAVVVCIPLQQLDPGSTGNLSVKVSWSGRVLNTQQSKKFFELTQSQSNMEFLHSLQHELPAAFALDVDSPREP